MKKLLLVIFVVFGYCSVAQHPVFVSPRIDTTNVRNKAILELWQEYRQKRWDNRWVEMYDFSEYWAESELRYKSFDFYRTGLSNLDFLYIYTPSYALQIDSVDVDMFSLRVMTMQPINYDSIHRDSIKCEDYYPAALFTVKIVRDSTGYKLTNAFTLNKARKQTYDMPPIRYYFDKDYPFDTLAVRQAHQKLLDFSRKYQLSFLNEPLIEFFVYSKRSQINKDFGFDLHPFSLPSDIVRDIGGTQIATNRMVFYGGPKSESNIHEVIHILLRQITPAPTMLEEGICTYYGGSMGKPYGELKAGLIKYLKKRPEIDFSTTNVFEISNFDYNHTYTIMAVLVEYAEKQWGPERVTEMLKFEAERSSAGDEVAFWTLVDTYFETEKSEFANFLRRILNANDK